MDCIIRGIVVIASSPARPVPPLGLFYMLAMIREYVMGALFIHQRRSSDQRQRYQKCDHIRRDQAGTPVHKPVHRQQPPSFRISRDLIQKRSLILSSYPPMSRAIHVGHFPLSMVGRLNESGDDNISDSTYLPLVIVELANRLHIFLYLGDC